MIFKDVVSDSLRRDVRIVFESKEIEDEIDKCLKEKAKTFRMHGFRTGHVPLDIVRNSVGGGAVKDAFDALISKACTECVGRLNVAELATTPVYRFENNYEQGRDVSIILTVEVPPLFELKPFECEVVRVIPKVSSDVVAEMRDRYLKLEPILEKAQKDHEIQRGDEVTYVAKCYNNGVESKKKSFQDKILIPEEFGENAEFFGNFLCKKIEDSFDFVVKDRDNMKYEFTIKSVKCPAKGLSIEEIAIRKGIKDLADFESVVKRGLEEDISDTAFIYHKSQILEYLGEQYDFDVPQSIFDYETKNLLAEIKRDAAEEERRTGQKQKLDSDEELAAEYADIIKKRVILGYVLNRFAKEKNIGVSQHDVQSAIMKEINKAPHLADKIANFYANNPDAVAYKKAEIIERKVVDFLMTQAKTNDVEKTKEELGELVRNLFEEDEDAAASSVDEEISYSAEAVV